MQRLTSPIFGLFACRGALLLVFGSVLLGWGEASAGDPTGNVGSLQSIRGACTAALALEARGETAASSREPCHRALRLGGTPEDERNEVASLMSPAATPSLDDLAVSALLVDAAERQAVDQPWAYLARCDIARRMGSADTLAACLADLRRVAPHHPAVAAALSQRPGGPSGGIWIVRAFLLIGLIGTALHAVYRARTASRGGGRATSPAPAGALIVACLFVSLLGINVARAATALPKEDLSHFKVDDADPEASVPTVEEQGKQPLEFGYFLQDLTARAERAGKAKDRAAEARYDRALTKAAPESAVGPRRLCDALEATGDLPNAIIACRTTLTRVGALSGDYIHFVKLVLKTTTPLAPLERKELDAVIAHLAHETDLGALPTMLSCDVALRFNDEPALEACTAELARGAPHDPKTISLQWALALQRHDRGAALGLIDKAREIGMSADGLAKMEKATRAMTLRWLGKMAAVAAIVALGGALLVAGLRRAAGNRRRLAI
jgi:hypothetical protein